MIKGDIMYRKKLFMPLLLLTLTILFVSCSAPEYRDDKSCRELAESVKDDALEYEEHDKEYLEFFFEDSSLQDDFCIIYSRDTNDITEIGIFHAPDTDSARKLLPQIEAYISEMQETQRAFIGSYAPLELTKLDGATVKRFGNYLVYTISDNTSEILSGIEEYLLKK